MSAPAFYPNASEMELAQKLAQMQLSPIYSQPQQVPWIVNHQPQSEFEQQPMGQFQNFTSPTDDQTYPASPNFQYSVQQSYPISPPTPFFGFPPQSFPPPTPTYVRYPAPITNGQDEMGIGQQGNNGFWQGPPPPATPSMPLGSSPPTFFVFPLVRLQPFFPRKIDQRRSQPVRRSPTKQSDVAAGCSFCKKNGETRHFYMNHQLFDDQKRVVCPILRDYKCTHCGATGDVAHTDSHCPNQPQDAPKSFNRIPLDRMANGKKYRGGKKW